MNTNTFSQQQQVDSKIVEQPKPMFDLGTVTVEVKPKDTMVSALSALIDEIGMLYKAVGDLEYKLGPILSPAPAGNTDPLNPRVPSAPLVEAVNDAADLQRTTIRRLMSILYRLEL